ncbi:MAG: hypothetical protein WKF30_13390 [Pyrinomonadaceae bacterium]
MRSMRLVAASLILWSGLCLAVAAREPWSRAVVVDERLAALRQSPAFDAPLVRRLSRGRRVTVMATRRGPEGIEYCRVAVTRRTRGWLQRESLIFPNKIHEDERLLRLINESEGFDRIARSRLFLQYYPQSKLRPVALAASAEAAELAALELTRAARRRFTKEKLSGQTAPEYTYYLNFSGLDRYNRQGINFIFNRQSSSFYYNGAHWREILRRYPRSAEAQRALRASSRGE